MASRSEQLAREFATAIGREITLARSNSGLSMRAAARLARVSPETQQRAETGDPSLQIRTVCRVASAAGLKVWGKAFPVAQPSLRDSGQLRVAEWLASHAHASLSVTLELPLANQRSIDMVAFGAEAILAIEIERLLADLQAQYRRAAEKREELAARHHRPVRLVLAVLDTERNRAAARPHAEMIRMALSAGSREVLAALRSGRALSRDGIVWIRQRRTVTDATNTQRPGRVRGRD